jgi:MFS family permease
MITVRFSVLLRENTRFRHLWMGQVVSELGNWFNFIAELGLARALSGSALSASLIVASHLLPFCVLGPFAGAIADRFPRRTVMIAADLARAVLALGFLLVTTPERLWIAYVCAAGLTSLAAFFEAAKNASMPNLARGKQLLPANALMHATRFMQMSVGAALGGLASEQFGHRAAFAINAVSFVVSAFYVARIPGHALENDPAESGAEDGRREAPRTIGSLARDLGDALEFIRRTPIVLAIMLLNFGWALGGGMNAVINDRFGGRVFALPGTTGDTGVAVLNGAAGMGLMLGMVAARRVSHWVSSREAVGPFMGWAIVASGLIFAVSGFMPSVWLMGAVFVVNRLVLSAEYAVQETVLMVALPDELRGKVMTLDRSVELATMALAALAGGALFEALPPQAVPVIAGVLMASPGFLWLLALAQGRLRVTRAALGA